MNHLQGGKAIVPVNILESKKIKSRNSGTFFNKKNIFSTYDDNWKTAMKKIVYLWGKKNKNGFMHILIVKCHFNLEW